MHPKERTASVESPTTGTELTTYSEREDNDDDSDRCFWIPTHRAAQDTTGRQEAYSHITVNFAQICRFP